MSTAIDDAGRQRFLTDVHVGVLSVADAGGPPGTLAVPIWYTYSSAVGVSVITSRKSRKGVAIEAAGRFTLVAQTEDVPYRYVSVEGPVVEIRRCELERDLRPMAVRYLGERAGAAYASRLHGAGTNDDHVFVMRPQRWLAADFTSELAAFTATT